MISEDLAELKALLKEADLEKERVSSFFTSNEKLFELVLQLQEITGR